MMEVALHIPDDVAKQMQQVNGQDIARHILEEYAIRAYQERTLGESHLRRLLGFETRDELEEFFAAHHVSSELYAGRPGTGPTHRPAAWPVMLVIAGNTPLRCLILLGYVDILPALYSHVIIPHAVLLELQHPHTPVVVRAWMANPPAWLEIRQTTSRADTALTELDAGERDAILLMQELNANLLLIDEGDGYGAATRRGMRCMRTVGLLEQAGIHGLLELPEAIARLRRTNFRTHPTVFDDVLARDAERKRQST